MMPLRSPKLLAGFIVCALDIEAPWEDHIVTVLSKGLGLCFGAVEV